MEECYSCKYMLLEGSNLCSSQRPRMRKCKNHYLLAQLKYRHHTHWLWCQIIFVLHYFQQKVGRYPGKQVGVSISDVVTCQEVSPTCYFYIWDWEGVYSTIDLVKLHSSATTCPELTDSPAIGKTPKTWLKNMQNPSGVSHFRNIQYWVWQWTWQINWKLVSVWDWPAQWYQVDILDWLGRLKCIGY